MTDDNAPALGGNRAPAASTMTAAEIREAKLFMKLSRMRPSKKRDAVVRQWREACEEAGLNPNRRNEAAIAAFKAAK